MTGQYTHDYTKAWSEHIAEADAFVVVTPEYNYTMPPSLLNAVDYLHHEWNRKPVGFVGYGAVGAARAIQMERSLFSSLNAMPVGPAVTMMGVYAPLEKAFVAEERGEKAADRMLAELQVWAQALKPTRNL
jgi:NAD(P)H-dependent FMN reductase